MEGHSELWEVMEMFRIFIVVEVARVYVLVRSHQTILCTVNICS